MNELSPSIWKRPWKGPGRAIAWFALLVAGGFLVICGIAWLLAPDALGHQLIPTAFLGAISLAVAGAAGFFFVRWVSSWRNFRRFLFVVACLVSLVALFYAEENWRGKHGWNKYRREWQAKGENFSLTALAPPPVPDDKNFALTPLLKPANDFSRGTNGVVWHDTNGLARLEKISAELPTSRTTNNHLVLGSVERGTFADVSACAEFYQGNTNYPQAPASARPSETILTALGKFGPELRELRAAAAERPYSRFPIQYGEDPPWGILLRHLARMEGLANLARVSALGELEAGHGAEAFEDLKLGFRFSDSIRDEPLLIDHLVRLAILAIDLQTLREGLLRHSWTEAQLAGLENYLGSVDLLREYHSAMRGERACELGGLDFLKRQGLCTDPINYLGSDEGGSSSTSTLPFNMMPGGWYYQNMLTICRMFQDFTLPVVDEKARRVLPATSENGARALAEMPRGPFTIFARILLPALGRAAQRSARMQTFVDAGRIACALERYRLANGKLPEALDALVPGFISRIPLDVIDGKPLRYRLDADGGYALYSIGWNQTDEGGKLAWTDRNREKPAVDFTKGDWVWMMPGSR